MLGSKEESMGGTLGVRSAPQFPSAYVVIARRWTQPFKRISNGYEFACAEPRCWATWRGTLWYRGATRVFGGSDLGIMEPGEFCWAK